MGIKDSGYSLWPFTGKEYEYAELLEIIVCEEVLFGGGKTRESVYEPTREDIKNLADKYGFDYDEIMETIKSSDRKVWHTLLIDMPIYRSAHNEIQE